MADNVERWHSEIKGRVGEPVSEKFYITEPESVGDDGITVRYLSVTGENPAGLPEGVYVQTNITPESYNADMVLRSLIRTHVVLALRDKAPLSETRPQSIGPVMDYANAISFQQAFVTRAGALVMQLSQGEQVEVERLIHGVESGEARMKFMPPEA